MYFNELTVGMKRTLPGVPVDEARMVDFAREFNPAPVHMDEAYAKTTTFGKLLAPGMYSFLLVWAAYMAQDFFGEALVAGKSTRVEWAKPVFAGDVLTGEAEITALHPGRSGRRGTAELTLLARNQAGEIVLRSTTEAVLQCAPPESSLCSVPEDGGRTV